MTEFRYPPGIFSPTPRQLECLQVIAEWIATYGCAPTYDEIAVEMEQLNKSGVARMVVGLVERGWLRTRPREARSIEIIHQPPMPDFSAIDWSLAPGLAAELKGEGNE